MYRRVTRSPGSVASPPKRYPLLLYLLNDSNHLKTHTTLHAETGTEDVSL